MIFYYFILFMVVIYEETFPSYLPLLNPIQNDGVKMATGIFRSFHRVILEVWVMPLLSRRKQFMWFLLVPIWFLPHQSCS